MRKLNQSIRGRGSAENPANRFEKIDYVPDEEELSKGASPKTEYYRDTTRSIIAYNDSPDVGFDAGINPYRVANMVVFTAMLGLHMNILGYHLAWILRRSYLLKKMPHTYSVRNYHLLIGGLKQLP